MFENKFKRIYVVCPASARTGGLELLHQLVFNINHLGGRATIAYTNIKDGNPINPAYSIYVKEYVDFNKLIDCKNALIIISEHQIELMDKFTDAEIAIWWLSVDNYQKVYNPKVAFKLLGIKGVAWYAKHARWRYRISKINKRIRYNFAQSYYAIDFLKENGFSNIEYLSDYISTDYLQIQLTKSSKRNNVILYNPKKGKKYTEYLMTLESKYKWIPLINLSNQQVKELLLSSKVYVDFGNHPGKDRFPREAAICGCCVITDKRGSAYFFKDVPIADQYKFEDIKENGPQIIDCIKKCFDNFETCFDDYNNYRKMISGEQEKFISDVENIFLK